MESAEVWEKGTNKELRLPGPPPPDAINSLLDLEHPLNLSDPQFIC